MPFASEKQRRFMHSQHPDIAKRWENEAKQSGKSAVKKEAMKRRLKKHKKQRR